MQEPQPRTHTSVHTAEPVTRHLFTPPEGDRSIRIDLSPLSTRHGASQRLRRSDKRLLWLISGMFRYYPAIPGHGAVVDRLTGWLEGQGCSLGLRPPTLGLRLVGALPPTLGAFLTLPTLLITLSESSLGSRVPREALVRSHMGTNSTRGSPEAPQRLNWAVTLALTLAAQAAHGDSPTYNYGKSRPTWTRRDSFLIPDRVVHLL